MSSGLYIIYKTFYINLVKGNFRRLVFLAVGFMLAFVAFRVYQSTQRDSTVISEGEVKIDRGILLQNDFTGAKISQGDLVTVLAKDGIPAINEPVFETAAEGDDWLEDDDRIFGVNYEGVVKAYPQRIMNWHEIVNDKLNDKYVSVTFCPLCGSAVAFERKVDGVVTEFGVSGKLHNSDLVMYDRYEGNLWQQITGEAIVGPAARRNEVLEKVPIITVPWSQWKEDFPDTLVLSRETGHFRDYNRYPYGTYEENGELLFGVENLDESLPLKEVVYGVEIEDSSVAFLEKAILRDKVIDYKIGEKSLKVSLNEDGEVAMVDVESGEKLVPLRLFWFAWAAFHPETEIYR